MTYVPDAIEPTPRGGKRSGAGRKREPSADTQAADALRRCNVMLDPASIAAHTARGDGNLSLGIRRAAVAGC